MAQAETVGGTSADISEPSQSRDTAVPGGQNELQFSALGPRPHLGLSQGEMNWAAAAHASVVLTVLLGAATGGAGAILGAVIPAAIWYAHRGRRDYVGDQARQATLFQMAWGLGFLALVLGGALVIVVGWLVTALLSIVIVGLALIPLMLALTVAWVIAVIALPILGMAYGSYAAAEAHRGRPFRYRWIPGATARAQTERV